MAGLTKEQQDVLNNPARRRDVLKQIEHIAASGQSDDFEGDVGPWMNTPLGKEAKSAWDRGMSKRKSEDNRDVFEKALDYAPVVAGAFIGSSVGKRLGRKYKASQNDKGSQFREPLPRRKMTEDETTAAIKGYDKEVKHYGKENTDRLMDRYGLQSVRTAKRIRAASPYVGAAVGGAGGAAASSYDSRRRK